MLGRCSEFGGKDDKTMANDTGLAFYEPWEADMRRDIFYKEDAAWLLANPGKRQPTWMRLNTEFYYIALWLSRMIGRKEAQNTPFKIVNPKNTEWAIAFIVDRGPNPDLNRLVDCSPGLLRRLGAKTNDLLEVYQLTTSTKIDPLLQPDNR